MANGNPPRKPRNTQKARAAAAENQRKQLKFRGLTLDLPPQMPGTVMFDLVEIEAEDQNLMPLMRLTRSVIGQEQFNQLRNTVDDEDSVGEVIWELIQQLFKVYGVSLGEASASQGS